MSDDKNVSVVIVDDEADARYVTKICLQSAGFQDLRECADAESALETLETLDRAVILLEVWMPGTPGHELVGTISERFPWIPVIMVTGANDAELAVQCMARGAFDYMVKPVENSRLIAGVQRACERVALELENERLRDRLLRASTDSKDDAFAHIITADPKMRGIFDYISVMAPTSRPVLITGETGTGKELIAGAIHELSGRTGELVTVNVAGLDDAMFSDTLFGHVRGAFTGADAPRAGAVEQAENGTLFLDEIGDLALPSQVKLLRLIANDEFVPLGSDRKKRAQCRIVAATNVDLEESRKAGTFRADLFYRLNTHTVYLPPLRMRKRDIPILVDRFADQASSELKKARPEIGADVLAALEKYPFPGNIRELESMIFEAVSRCGSGPIALGDFAVLTDGQTSAAAASLTPAESREAAALTISGEFPTIKEATDYLVAEAMRRSSGNQTRAAALLGISRPAVSKRLKNMNVGNSGKMVN